MSNSRPPPHAGFRDRCTVDGARRPVKPLSSAQIRGWAQSYVSRWYGTEAALRASLERRCVKALGAPLSSSTEATRWIEQVLQELRDAGAVDDLRWAEQKASAMVRAGASLLKIRHRLLSKGLDHTVVGRALDALRDEHDDQGSDPRWAAALAYARRRRFGPFRRGPMDRQRELRAMARAGHSFGLSARIVDASSEEELDFL